ncbi:MAG: hypothetical protein JNL98_39750 [Bryobacterales bacterium]|nr:hypothetical protein [Bryobacterales bacterium]
MKTLILMCALGVGTLSAQVGYRVTYSEPAFSGTVFYGYQTIGPLIGAQAAGCTDNVYSYAMGVYGQLGWSCVQGPLSGNLLEWTDYFQVAVFVQWSASRWTPSGIWNFLPSITLLSIYI